MKNTTTWAAALAMLFSSLALPLAAGERRGSIVEVTLSDGRMVKGELLAVKGHELVIHDRYRRQGFTVNIEQVSGIRIKRKSRVLGGLASGFISGMAAGAAIAGSRSGGDSCEQTGPAIAGLMCWGAATIIGVVTGAVLSRPEEMATNGREPVQVNAYLRHLQKHARN